MTSKDRLVYSGRKFLPGQGPFATEFKGKPLGGTFVNLWRGWGCEPVKGDVSPFINLVKRLCDSKEDEVRYLIWRIAIKVQKPWLKIPSYVLIDTKEEGTGKSQLVKFVSGLYGAHGKIITDREMETDFDDWRAAGILFVGAEEVSFKDKRSVANRLKAIASMEVDRINPKGQPSYQVENFFDLFFTANNPDAIYIRNDRERRPFVVMHNTVTPMSKSERDKLQSWYDNGGKEALLYYFMHEVDGDAFDPYDPAPLTTGRTEMAEANQTPAERFVVDMIADASEDMVVCPLKDFKNILGEYVGDRAPSKRDEADLCRALRKEGSYSRRLRFNSPQVTLYPIRDLAVWEQATNEEWASEYRECLARTPGSLSLGEDD
jgi:hypothetical protein